MPLDPVTGRQLSTRDYEAFQKIRSFADRGNEGDRNLERFVNDIDSAQLAELVREMQSGAKHPLKNDLLREELSRRHDTLRDFSQLTGEGSYNPGSFRDEDRVAAPAEPTPDTSRFNGPRGVPSRWRKPADTLSEDYPRDWQEFLQNMVDAAVPTEGDSLDAKIAKVMNMLGPGGIGMLAGRKGAERLGGDVMRRFNAADDARAGGKSAYGLWRDYRIEPGVEGKFRFEIPDQGMALKPKLRPGGGTFGRATDMIDHAELFKAYPELREYGVSLQMLENPALGRSGRFSRQDRMIDAAAGSENELLQTLLHELQHGVQSIERFPPGTNPGVARLMHPESLQESPQLVDRLKQLGYTSPDMRAYGRHAGEVEARNVEGRFIDPNLSAFAPSLTEDIYRGWQIGYK